MSPSSHYSSKAQSTPVTPDASRPGITIMVVLEAGGTCQPFSMMPLSRGLTLSRTGY